MCSIKWYILYDWNDYRNLMGSSEVSIRILFLADTHLGYDLPMHPRIQRRRRGYDFFANYESALSTAVNLKVDCLIHGGDLFFRSRVPREVVHEAFRHMKHVVAADIPFFMVPGNHERSRIPYPMMVRHANYHIFDHPRTYVVQVGKLRISLSGFPFYRGSVREDFRAQVKETGWWKRAADVNLLCVHHSFEGATVGPGEYVFRYGKDVARLRDVPSAFLAVLSGHIHRHQVITKDLDGRVINTPVLYPGSIERTSFAEKNETKGYLLIEISKDGTDPPRIDWEFIPLQSRPMLVIDLTANESRGDAFGERIRQAVAGAPVDAVLRLQIRGPLTERMRREISAGKLRELSPSTMNIEAVLMDETRHRHQVKS